MSPSPTSVSAPSAAPPPDDTTLAAALRRATLIEKSSQLQFDSQFSRFAIAFALRQRFDENNSPASAVEFWSWASSLTIPSRTISNLLRLAQGHPLPRVRLNGRHLTAPLTPQAATLAHDALKLILADHDSAVSLSLLTAQAVSAQVPRVNRADLDRLWSRPDFTFEHLAQGGFAVPRLPGAPPEKPSPEPTLPAIQYSAPWIPEPWKFNTTPQLTPPPAPEDAAAPPDWNLARENWAQFFARLLRLRHPTPPEPTSSDDAPDNSKLETRNLKLLLNAEWSRFLHLGRQLRATNKELKTARLDLGRLLALHQSTATDQSFCKFLRAHKLPRATAYHLIGEYQQSLNPGPAPNGEGRTGADGVPGSAVAASGCLGAAQAGPAPINCPTPDLRPNSDRAPARSGAGAEGAPGVAGAPSGCRGAATAGPAPATATLSPRQISVTLFPKHAAIVHLALKILLDLKRPPDLGLLIAQAITQSVPPSESAYFEKQWTWHPGNYIHPTSSLYVYPGDNGSHSNSAARHSPASVGLQFEEVIRNGRAYHRAAYR